MHNALIVSLHLCKLTLLSSHPLLSLSTQSLSCQHWDPDRSQSHALNTVSMLMFPKFTSLALTSVQGFGLTAKNSLVSNRYVKLNTFKTKLSFLPLYSPSLCMATHPFRFSCPKPRCQPEFLSPSAPVPHSNPSGLDCCWIFWLSLQNILNLSISLHPHPSHFTFLQCFSTKLRRKIQTPYLCPKALPTSQISSCNNLSLDHSFIPAFVLPSKHPLYSHLRAFALVFPSSWNDIIWLACTYSGLGSSVTSSEKWSLPWLVWLGGLSIRL